MIIGQKIGEGPNAEVEHWIIPVTARKLSSDSIDEDKKQLLLNEIKMGISF
ncbi:hypothetical protein [Ornithinibacillus sp. 179-J 7C1 HS]|uniref:hypothetical protein n=1 Tax=Ornithinibacillus sp. 179-J 7C1 HS TaxID=3142384 RepID=UPI0039A3C740